MDRINAFEIQCCGITVMLLRDILRRNRREKLRLFLSAAPAGFILELPPIRGWDGEGRKDGWNKWNKWNRSNGSKRWRKS